MSWRSAIGVMALAAVAAVGCWLSMSGEGADRILARSYSSALEGDTRWERHEQPSLVLSRFAGQETHAPAAKALAIGDRVTIGSVTASEVYEVVKLETIDGAAIGLAGVRLQVVTGRAEGASAEDDVKFIFVVDGAVPAAAKKERSL